jgi:hypothetical protein
MLLAVAGSATVAETAIMVVIDAPVAVGVYRRCNITTLMMEVRTMMAIVATKPGMSAMFGMATGTAAAMNAMRVSVTCSAQTKHNCERENRNSLSEFHDLFLLVEHVNDFSPARWPMNRHPMLSILLWFSMSHIDVNQNPRLDAPPIA